MDGYDSGLSLLFRAHTQVFALPLADVIETMRPLPVEVLAGAPRYVRGVSVIRGEPVPVVDMARLLRDEESTPARFVTIAVRDRKVALAVDSVLGVRALQAGSLQALPPLLEKVDLASAIGTLDAELLLVFQGTRLVPDDFWAALDGAERSA